VGVKEELHRPCESEEIGDMGKKVTKIKDYCPIFLDSKSEEASSSFEVPWRYQFFFTITRPIYIDI
jgi:hypothetical protein